MKNIFLSEVANGYQILQLDAAEHLAPSVKTKLRDIMVREARYTPRLNSRGEPMRCKSSGCCERAMAGARKQLRPTHYAAFLEKSNRARAMPRCTRCNVHTQMELFGEPCCTVCGEKELEKLRAADQARDAQARKLREIDNVETVHDLREWIKEYLL
jgi:hypothetical protein